MSYVGQGVWMKCPYCAGKTRVTDKRESPEGIRRRRECLKCKKRVTTYEKIGRSEVYVIKKDGRRERFSREKLESGIHRAFEKRPVSKEKIEKMINEIEEMLMRRGRKEIQSSVIGELVMRRIKRLDNIAYIRFASVYRDFQDIKDFKTELGRLKR
ncbi:MAG: transcriptional regulator NrdR [Nanoarchaeota archaeon]|nr:transcriptional regulator NrdR [Nanoarchaeota archaeon]